MFIRDKNTTGLPIVNEGWFQVANDQTSRIPLSRTERACDASAQAYDHSSGEVFRSPFESHTELTQRGPHGGLTSIHKAPFSFAEARLLNSHGEAFVYPTRNIKSLAPEPLSIPGLELKERDITLANLAEIQWSAGAVCVTHSNLP